MTAQCTSSAKLPLKVKTHVTPHVTLKPVNSSRSQQSPGVRCVGLSGLYFKTCAVYAMPIRVIQVLFHHFTPWFTISLHVSLFYYRLTKYCTLSTFIWLHIMHDKPSNIQFRVNYWNSSEAILKDILRNIGI